jgi:hypothetical protein
MVSGVSRTALRMVPAVLALASCSGGQNAQDQLSESLTDYCMALRWQQYDRAVAHVPPAQQRSYLEAHDHLEEAIDVTDLEVTRRIMSASGKEVTALVALSWIAKDDPVVRKSVIELRWERRGDRWQLVREKTVRGPPLPQALRRPATAPASAPH